MNAGYAGQVRGSSAVPAPATDPSAAGIVSPAARP